MAVLHYDQKLLKLRVLVKTDECFTPSTKLTDMQLEADSIFNEYQELIGKLKVFLKKCEDWNKENDEEYQKAVEKTIEKKL